MTKKRAVLSLAAVLAFAASIVAVIPQAGVAAGPLQAGGQLLVQLGSAMMDECEPAVCAGGAIHGPVGFLDGGQSCSCP